MPEISEVHVDQILTNISVQYKNAAFVADQILPVVPVKKESDKYYVYTKKDRFTVPNTLRAPRTESRQVDWSISTATYSCEEYALSALIDDRERANADKPIDIDIDTVETLTDLLLLDYEKRVASMLTDTSIITQNVTLSGTDQWSDYANSDPISNIETAKQTVFDSIFKEPNIMVMGIAVYRKLKHHPDILDRIKYTGRGIVTVDILQDLFEIPKILVAGTAYNSANEGQTPSYSSVWGKNVIVAYVEPRPGLKKVSLGYTLRARAFQVRKAREEKKHSDWVEVSVVQDEKIVAASAGYLIKTAVA